MGLSVKSGDYGLKCKVWFSQSMRNGCIEVVRGLGSEELRCKELLGLSLTMCTLNGGTELNTKLSRQLSCLSQGLFADEAPLKH